METIYSKNAIKALKNLDRKIAKRIIEAINKIPLGDIKPLKNFTSAARLRVGDYRILFAAAGNIVHIDDVLSRGSAYKK